ncbi:chromate transporter [Alicyclobacillus sp. SO9]|uniref:chromate transporter n=1 Tax=Alicyclobacillus sp. SO9 TaxID=2665646 RepID=UPI0018E8E5E0|nr:chromate transporter [Alicyclobacillus sp. SO9]QQE79360.1 chromate transporter [Alicyclobacillus sp. SO9]
MSLQIYRELVVAFVRTGVVGYGGGPSIIPLIRHEAVTRYKWVSDEEFGEILALANTLPGPIATKMASYLGYRTAGTIGSLVALVSHILLSVLGMVFLLGALTAFRKSPIVRGMISAVDPVVVVMLGIMAYEFSAKSVKGLGKWLSLGFGVLIFILIEVVHVPVGFIVAGALLYGAFHLRLAGRLRKKHSDGKTDKGASL